MDCLSAAAMTADVGVAVGLWLCFMVCYVKNSTGSECNLSVRIHSVLGCAGTCGNTSRKHLLK